MDLSVAVVTYNCADEVCNLLKSVTDNTKKIEYTLNVIDNASEDNTVELVKEKFPTVNVIELPENVGFGGGHNQMLTSESRYHAVLNPDISFDSDVLSSLVSYLDSHPDVVMVTPKILNPDGTEQHLPKRKPTFKRLVLGRLSRYLKFLHKYRAEYTMENLHLDKPTEIEMCTGCFMVMRTEIFKKIGGFDESFFMYMEDCDLTDRMRKYGKVIFNPDYSVTHNWAGGSSRNFTLIKYHIKSMFKYLHKQRKNK